MEARINETGTIRLRKIDVVGWDSPVAQQFEIDRLPTLLLYRGKELMTADTQEVLRFVNPTP